MPGKLACGLAQINKLFLIALAPAANQKVQTFLDAHPQRHGLVHRLREYPHHLAAFGRVFADEFYKRRLPPVSSRENRRVADGRWIVWFLRHQTVPPAGVSNQFISRHSRNDQFRQRKTVPRDHHGPSLHATMPVNTPLDWANEL